MRAILLVLGCTLALSASPALAQSQSDDDPAGAGVLAEQADEQVSVTADTLEINEEVNQALFTGNVTVVQGEMELFSQILDVLYGEGGPSDLVSFTASGGRVRMVTEDQTIDGDQAMYDFTQRILTFTGNVVVNNESGEVRSDSLIIDTRAGTSSFAGGPAQGGRVTSTFTPTAQ